MKNRGIREAEVVGLVELRTHGDIKVDRVSSQPTTDVLDGHGQERISDTVVEVEPIPREEHPSNLTYGGMSHVLEGLFGDNIFSSEDGDDSSDSKKEEH